MSFDSLSFFVFLVIVFGLYWLTARNLRIQNLLVVVASYVFYGWWDWRFLSLIAFTSGWVFVSGLFDDRGGRKFARMRLVFSLVVNLGVLVVYKYCDFFIGSLSSVLAVLGFHADFVTLHLILPVGISFYTFQALSYSIDVYRGDIKPTRDPLAFFAFISFFPQLVAGPIERATNLLPQFLCARKFKYPLAVEGCRQMLWGYLKKVVMADSCASAANAVLNNSHATTVSLWVGMVLFAFQIYGDFSGYSDIAIGCSKLFGVRLCRNFAYPYFSRNIGEFWRRWHISLLTWFRDYIYIPIGGGRCGTGRKIRNTFAVFLISGLWHGANWTFMLWGLFHAICFVPTIIFNKGKSTAFAVIASGRILPSVKELVQMAFTFLLVVVGWTFFRAPTAGCAFSWLGKMLTFSDLSYYNCYLSRTPTAFTAVGGVLLVEWFNRQREIPGLPSIRWLRWLVYYAAIYIAFRWKADPQAFIYFQF